MLCGINDLRLWQIYFFLWQDLFDTSQIYFSLQLISFRTPRWRFKRLKLTLLKMYKDAINCFCSRTAWEMRRLVEKYLLSGEKPYINKRMWETPAAVLRLIFNNINQTAQLNRAIKLRNQVEEEIKFWRDGKNIASLPPVPPIIDTNKGEKNIAPEKGKRRKGVYIAYVRARNFSGSNERRKKFAFKRKWRKFERKWKWSERLKSSCRSGSGRPNGKDCGRARGERKNHLAKRPFWEEGFGFLLASLPPGTWKELYLRRWKCRTFR